MNLDAACPNLVLALENDPFYRAICGRFIDDKERRRELLARYFDYSIREGQEIGRCVHLERAAVGVAVWLLPQALGLQESAAERKREFLQTALDKEGFANYYAIVESMSEKAASIVPADAWYLSIVAVDPAEQGKGLGRRLLKPTLEEAARAGATCYLETFSTRNVSFYERLGFVTKTRVLEPTTNAEYAVMVREA